MENNSGIIQNILASMTLKGKALLCSGSGAWHTQGVPEFGLKELFMTDGPQGVRISGQKATCFPSPCCYAASFDTELAFKMGQAIAEECIDKGVSILLGPGLNIKRSARCGRNFEYYSEDPLLSGKLAAAFIKGVQSKGVAACAKHYAANNQEYRRMVSDSIIDKQTLHEIYLKAFEIAVREGSPDVIMSSYNKINGKYAGESVYLLDEVLRKTFAFDGVVMSDWGAVHDRVKALEAGLDLEMPSSGGLSSDEIVSAINEGRLNQETLNKSAERVLKLLVKYNQVKHDTTPEDIYDKHHLLAKQIAAESIVLLENNGILPLKSCSLSVIGQFAKFPRFRGGGSSYVDVKKYSCAYDAISAHIEGQPLYAQGYSLNSSLVNQKLIDEAVDTSKRCDVAIVFAGLPEHYESEGYDREDISLPPDHLALIDAVCAANKNTVVVLSNGSVVEIPFAKKCAALLECFLPGQNGGEAICDILFGKANPCGRLPETFPLRLEDTPDYLFFKGFDDRVRYGEGLFVGYRYYTSKKMAVQYPFGYGLSYTSFDYCDFKVKLTENGTVKVSVKVKNTGNLEGKEVVQIYVSDTNFGHLRPVKELKAFKKISLQPGETKAVEFTLSNMDFSYYDTDEKKFLVRGGDYKVIAAKNSMEDIFCRTIRLPSQKKTRMFERDSCVGDIVKTEVGRQIIENELYGYLTLAVLGNFETNHKEFKAMENPTFKSMIENLPLYALVSLTGGKISSKDIDKIVMRLNNQI